jgi:dihydropteroate synthase
MGDLPQADRCLVMGVLNVTPDSFSDGGRWLEPAAAVRRGLQLLAEGADILDVGGESTRPGADRPPVAEELRRVLPVVDGLAAAGALVSIDTMRAEVAARCIEAGAGLVNDVSGGRADPGMLDVVAQAGVPLVLMHWRGHSAGMQDEASYDDVVAEVTAEIEPSVEAAVTAGIRRDRLVIDPGLGFAKLAAHNWSLMAHLDALTALGLPVLVGGSRKRFLGELLATESGELRPAAGRDDASAALTVLAAAAGAWGVRVHEVRASADAVRVVARWARG